MFVCFNGGQGHIKGGGVTLKELVCVWNVGRCVGRVVSSTFERGSGGVCVSGGVCRSEGNCAGSAQRELEGESDLEVGGVSWGVLEVRSELGEERDLGGVHVVVVGVVFRAVVFTSSRGCRGRRLFGLKCVGTKSAALGSRLRGEINFFCNN